MRVGIKGLLFRLLMLFLFFPYAAVMIFFGLLFCVLWFSLEGLMLIPLGWKQWRASFWMGRWIRMNELEKNGYLP